MPNRAHKLAAKGRHRVSARNRSKRGTPRPGYKPPSKIGKQKGPSNAGKPVSGNGSPVTTIRITVTPNQPPLDPDITYAPSQVHLRAGVGEVEWQLTGGGEFEIEFVKDDGSPFDDDHYSDKHPHARVRMNAKDDFPYHYNLVSANGETLETYDNCPEIIVQR
jgi:hypothetical protein